MDFSKLPLVSVGDEKFDDAFVIVDQLTGYTMAIPCLGKGLNAEKAASLLLEKCFFFTGLPHEIMSDNDKVISKDFFETLCALSGSEQHKGVIYCPQSNGRAEVAVKLVVNSLRRYLADRKGNWVHALPLALWSLNDLPGLVSPYSPGTRFGLWIAPPMRLRRVTKMHWSLLTGSASSTAAAQNS